MTNDVSIPAEDIVQIYDLLYRLGVTANHAGFFHTAYAVYLAAKQSDRLLLAAKWIYPKVARHYGITGYCAVRSIDMASRTAWLTNRALLEELTSRPLPQRPTAAEILAILVSYFDRRFAA